MASHDTRSCPRCWNPFECKMGNILQCQCNGISFNTDEKEYIAANYDDCLCRSCLLEIKQELRLRSLK